MPPHVDLLESAQHRPGGARHRECLHGAAAAAAQGPVPSLPSLAAPLASIPSTAALIAAAAPLPAATPSDPAATTRAAAVASLPIAAPSATTADVQGILLHKDGAMANSVHLDKLRRLHPMPTASATSATFLSAQAAAVTAAATGTAAAPTAAAAAASTIAAAPDAERLCLPRVVG